MATENYRVEDLNLENEEDEISQLVSAFTNPDEFYAKNVFRVVYQTNNFLLPQIRDMIKQKSIINIRPEYQRRLRWTRVQKSKLIESLLLNIPVPSVFFYESEAARYEVMDGQQRLNAIKEFLDNEFRLTELNVLWPLNNLSYADCPPRIKRGLDRSVISSIILLLESDVDSVQGKKITHSDIRRFIFDRLNTGGTRLNAQELRNAIYPGLFNDTIIKIARHKLFTEIWGIPPYTETNPNEYYENPKRQSNKLYSSMMDCQIVLRFFALRDEENIRGAMKGMLDRAMESNLKIFQDQADEYYDIYIQRLNLSYEIFQGKPFVLDERRGRRPRLSVALHDAVMVTIDHLWDKRQDLTKNSNGIRNMLQDFIDEGNHSVLTGQGNTASAVKEMISVIQNMMLSCI